jgi:hypothetical protein
MGQFHPRLGDVEKPPVDHRGLLHSAYLAYLWAIVRADGRTRTADLISSYEKHSAGLGVSRIVAQVVCPSLSIYGMG